MDNKILLLTLPLGGPLFSAVRSLVMGCLLPISTYGIQFLSGAASISNHLRLIQSSLLQPLRRVLGLPGSAQILSVLVECDCPTLIHFRQQQILSYVQRLVKLPIKHAARRLLGETFNRQETLVAAAAASLSSSSRSPSLFLTPSPQRPFIYEAIQAETDFKIECCKQLKVDSTLSPAEISPSDSIPPLSPLLPPPPLLFSSSLLSPLSATPPVIFSPVLPSNSFSLSSSSTPVALPSNSSAKINQPREKHSTLPSLKQIARKRTFEQWQASEGGATLKLCKKQPGRSEFLYLEPHLTQCYVVD